ncbi:TPA: hypothetical protein HA243_04805 [Candidatus Micrarchaeota archaeon]|nr:hypothetical protein [Candidatus Micrarchaeota archaeon]
MRLILLAFSVLALLQAAFAAAYTNSYSNEWAKITRTTTVSESLCPEGVTGVCASTGASSPSGIYGTEVNITVENAGLIERKQVQVTESLLHVPAGARINFEASPSVSDGHSATFHLGNLFPGGKKSFLYSFAARISEKEALAMAAPIVSSETVRVMLAATEFSKVGSRVSLTLRTLSGQAIPGTLIRVGYPDGTSQDMRTDFRGQVSFIAEKEGFYTYAARGYTLERIVSTSVGPEEEPSVPTGAGAVLVDEGLGASLSGLLPVLAAMFGLGVLALIIYNFFVSREEEEEVPEQPSKPQQYYSTKEPEQPSKKQQYYGKEPETQSPMYSQKITFAPASNADEGSLHDATRGLVESRKKMMQASEVASNEPQHNNLQAGAKLGKALSAAENSTATSRKGAQEEIRAPADEAEVEQELEKLEEEAEGELEGQEEEIEKAIAELEEIRKKLRERREQVLSVEEKLEREVEEEREPEPQKKPQPRIMPPTERQEPKINPSFGKKK